MSRTGVANLLCTYCFRTFKLPIWLEKHINKEHPQYRSPLHAPKKRAADPEQYEGRPRKNPHSSSRTILHNGESLIVTDAIANYNVHDDGTQLENEPINELENAPTTHTYPDAGLPCAYVPRPDESIPTNCDPYYPFANEEEFNFAEMVVVEKFSAKSIDRMLKDSVGVKDEIKASLKSNYILRQMLDRMEDGLGSSSWRISHLENIVWNAQHAKEPIKFWHRDIVECAKWLLKQPAYAEHLSYAPQQRFEEAGRRVYGEMHTADWWWERQSSLDDGDTVVPMIFFSDATHLTNFSGDKKAWPVYMTIGNLSAAVRMAPSQHGILLIALLPIPVKMRDVPISIYNHQKEHNRMIQQHVLHHVLGPLMDDRRIFYTRCADGFFRHCVALPAAWIADYPEHRDLHNVINGFCYWCECPREKMGEYPVVPYGRRDHSVYKMLSESNTTAAKARLARHRIHSGSNVLWHLDCEVSDLPKPDLLHTMQLGMLKHLLGWLQDFLKQHKRLEAFNNIWLSVPSYLDMPQPQKAYEEVSNWQGKEIKVMSRFLVGVLRCALRIPSSSQRGVFDEAIECCRALVEFYFYAQYESHDEETLSLMNDALQHFHITKRVFRQFRVTKKVTHQGREYRKTLIEQRDTAMQHGKSVVERERLRKEWQTFINAEMVEFHEEGSDFNFPKIHQLLHFGEQIRRYGSLKQWSTESGESSHRTQLKDPYNKSNRSGNIYGQMIEYYQRSDAFAIRRLNIAAMRGENSNRNGSTREDPLAGIQFTSAQTSSGPAKITTFASLVTSVRDDHLRNELRYATNRFLLSRKIELAPEDLLQCAVTVYQGMRITLSNMHGESVIQHVRCTGEKSWYGQPARRDWVWVKTSNQREGQEPAYAALRGRLPYRLLKLFKLFADGRMLCCAFVQTTTPAAGGTPEKASRMVRVIKPTTGSSYAVISDSSIVGAAHLIPEEADCSGIPNKGWIVNSHIDLDTWNEVY